MAGIPGVVIDDVKENFTKIVSANTNTTALTKAQVACAAALSKTQSGQRTVPYFCGRRPCVRLAFAVNGDGATVNYDVIGWTRFGTVWVPEWLAVGVATGGAKLYTVAGLGTTTYAWCDTLTDTLGKHTVVYSPADDSKAILTVNTRGAEYIEVRTDLGTATAADVWAAGGTQFPFDQLRQIQNALGGFSEDGGAAADDSVKAALDLLSTYLIYDGYRVIAQTYTPRAAETTDLFDVTGLCEGKVLATCTVGLVNGAGSTTISLGFGAGADVAALIAATDTDALATGELWFDATPTTTRDTSANAWLGPYIWGGGVTDTLSGTVVGDVLTAGTIVVVAAWRPLAGNGAVALHV